jgi:hypothetical protein
VLDRGLIVLCRIVFSSRSIGAGGLSTVSLAHILGVAERNNRLMATTVSFADSITADKCSPNVFRVNARAGMQSAALADWLATTQKDASVFYLGPDYEMGRSTVAAFKSAAEGKGAKTAGEVFAPLDNKDYSPYFGQIRSASVRSQPLHPHIFSWWLLICLAGLLLLPFPWLFWPLQLGALAGWILLGSRWEHLLEVTLQDGLAYRHRFDSLATALAHRNGIRRAMGPAPAAGRRP